MGEIESAMGCSNGWGSQILFGRLPHGQVCRIQCNLEACQPFTGRASVVCGRWLCELQQAGLS